MLKRKNSSKFVYILAKQCRSHFNLTNFFDRKNSQILISRKFEIFTKTSHLKLVGTPCIVQYLCMYYVYLSLNVKVGHTTVYRILRRGHLLQLGCRHSSGRRQVSVGRVRRHRDHLVKLSSKACECKATTV